MSTTKPRYSLLSMREASEAIAVNNKLILTKLKQSVAEQLRESGFGRLSLMRGEPRDLHKYLFPGEAVAGAIYGHSKDGTVMLTATDRRIVYFDKKPLFIKVEDISYDVLSGITLRWVLYSGTVILHTRLGDIAVKTRNRTAAEIFKKFIDSKIQNKQTEPTSFSPPLARLPLARSRI